MWYLMMPLIMNTSCKKVIGKQQHHVTLYTKKWYSNDHTVKCHDVSLEHLYKFSK